MRHCTSLEWRLITLLSRIQVSLDKTHLLIYYLAVRVAEQQNVILYEHEIVYGLVFVVLSNLTKKVQI